MSIPEISRGTGESLYSQISRYLEEEITQMYQPGDMLPAESILAARFNVNRHTLRRAVDELVHAGLLERRQGAGTFVLSRAMDYPVAGATRFTENISALGLGSETRVSKTIVVPARGGVTKRLQIAESTRVIWIETLRLVDNIPFCLVSHFIPYDICPGLEEKYAGGSLHQLIEQETGRQLKRIESLVTTCLPQGDDASLLGVSKMFPVLRVKSINVDQDTNVPIEYALTRFRADLVQLRIEP